MNEITEITRRNIFDYISVKKINWSGRLDETVFLSRLYNLDKMPTTDGRYESMAGDIYQHRINNYDWTDDWVFSDPRLNLMTCEDSIFLNFVCEIIHPVVRTDAKEIQEILQSFNGYLKEDGFEIVEKTKISNRSVFAGRKKFKIGVNIENRNKEIIDVLSEDYVLKQINIMESNIDTNPELSIGTAKELTETICKTILKEKGYDIDKNWDVPRLLKETTSLLQLTPQGVSDEKRASQTIKGILGSLSNVVQGICELRNDYGSGHGKDAKYKGLTSRHARLAVGASSTLAIFLLETHKERN